VAGARPKTKGGWNMAEANFIGGWWWWILIIIIIIFFFFCCCFFGPFGGRS
jgi:type II secretory pathway component PulF